MSNTFFQGGEQFSREGFAPLVTGLATPSSWERGAPRLFNYYTQREQQPSVSKPAK